MSYYQIETQGGYITRSLMLSINARSNGYPGYSADITDERRSIRTILYVEDDRIYLTDDKIFVLTQKMSNDQGYEWIFSADPLVDPLTLSEIMGIWGMIVYPWRSEWANMKTDEATRNDLLWPVRTWEEALALVDERSYTVMFNRISDGRWISAIDSFGGDTFVTAGFAWKLSGAPFNLIRRNNVWGLRYLEDGIPDAEAFITLRPPREGTYVRGWREGASDRWLLTENRGRALFWNISSPEDGLYQFIYNGKRLNQGGCWRITRLANCRLGTLITSGGVEFNNANSYPLIDMRISVIEPRLSDTDRYLFDQNRFVLLKRDQDNLLPVYNPYGVLANLPRGSGFCTENQWDGMNVNCYMNASTPYTAIRGQEQCQYLDDFTSDIHCQSWATTNRGQAIDQKMIQLCRDVPPDQYQSVCGCYRSDQIYTDALLQQRRDDPELARQIANDVRATNLLQCVSGLCTPGSLSADLFYHSGRRCDVCIQALRLNLQSGGNISGDINLRQVCTQADASYTWSDLVQRLIDLGAYRVSSPSGIYPHVIVNQSGTSIKLITSTPQGSESIKGLRNLSLIERDTQGNIILTQERWRSNPSAFSNEVLIFFLEAREEL